MEAVASTPRPRPWNVALPALVAAYVVVVVVAVPRSSTAPLTTYAGASPAERIADLSAGFGLLGAGLLAWIELRAKRLGLLAILAGIAWFGPDWDGWARGPELARSLGAVAAPFVLALVFHLVAAFPDGRIGSRLATGAVAAGYGLTAVASVALALFRDPFLDFYCWRNCVDNAFLVDADQHVARVVARGWHFAALSIGLLVIVSVAWRWRIASGTARRVLWPLLASGLLVGAAEAAYAVALLRTPLESPTSAGFSSLFLVRSLALVALALGLTREVVRGRRTRAAVARLAIELGDAPPPGTLRETLAVALGDPTLDVAYWLPRSQRFVDAAGQARSEPLAERGRAVTPILRAGRPVAVVVHDDATVDGSRLQREIGGAARLAVENEQLQAEVLAQLTDLRASRVRIVELGDAARRRIERDLHDGAQQRMLALSYELRLARVAASAAHEHDLAELLRAASDAAQATLGDLRGLAHGIFPAILAEAGLGPALATLAATTPIAVELDGVADERFPPAVESAAYVVVSEAVADAAARHASFLTVTAACEAERLLLDLRDDGEPRGTSLVHISDRVGALGGTMRLAASAVHVEIPCE